MKAVIYDVDGTLVDSVDLHTKAWEETFRHFERPQAFDAIRAQIGKGGDQLLPVFLSRDEFEEKGEEMDKFRGEYFKKHFLQKVEGFPQVRALFLLLQEDGWKLALASSAKEAELKTYKKVSQIEDLIETQTSTDDAEKSKPHPDIFLAAMQRLGKVDASDCIVVGDSPCDAEAASKAGMRSIGFLCGGFPEDKLRASGYETLYRDAADLLKNYKNSVFFRERPDSTVSR